MTDTWEKAIAFVLDHEGGYVNDPNDMGGETKYGISKRAYPDLDIATLTPDEAKAIYKKDYWDKLGCDKLGYPHDMVAFDAGVNCGLSRSQMWLSESTTWQDMILMRVYYYVSLAKKENYRVYLRGWLNRTMELYRTVRTNGNI